MSKIRVYELAKELNMDNKDLLNLVKQMSLDSAVKTHMSSLDDDVVEKIRFELFNKSKKVVVDDKRVKANIIRRRKKVVEEKKDLKEVKQEEEQEEEVVVKEDIEKDIAQEEESSAKEEIIMQEETLETEKLTGKEEDIKKEEDIPKDDEVKESVKAKEDKKEVQDKPELKEKKEESKSHVKIIERPKPVVTEEKPTPVKKEKASPTKETPKKAKKKAKVEIVGFIPGIKEAQEEEDEAKADAKKGKKWKKSATKDPFKKEVFEKKRIIKGDALNTSNSRRRHFRKKDRDHKKGEKTLITTPKAIKRRIKMGDTIILSDLAKNMGVKANEIIQKLMEFGTMVTVNQVVDFETAQIVSNEFKYEVEKINIEEDIIANLKKNQEDDEKNLKKCAPVVTIMGHVDHGKTSLLDVIRKSKITAREAGGITQHIGAYRVKSNDGNITFLDTPGHEAFTAMRARGAKVTNIVVLVVAADDGVMPRTIEAISHSKAANVPIIVAINKIDLEGANPDKIKNQLAELDIIPEEWGGKNIFVEVSAKEKIGIDNLLEMILLQADMLELKANPDKGAYGYVVESKLDKGRGAVATLLVKEGTLKKGQALVCGMYSGRVRAMYNEFGKTIGKATPSMPVEIIGLSGVPVAGDEFFVIENEKDAKQVSIYRQQQDRAKVLAKSNRVSFEAFFDKLEKGEVKNLNLIIKVDVQGSVEAISQDFGKLNQEKVKINIIHSGVGDISEMDVSLASVSNAIIIGFCVKANTKAQHLAEEENISIRYYDVIYKLVSDVENAMLGLLDPIESEKILGSAEIRKVFVTKKGKIAGSYVIDGKILKGEKVRIKRDDEFISEEVVISSLKRFDDDVKEVLKGYECGVVFQNFNDINEGDIIECFTIEKSKATSL